jgi:ATP-dependent DNA helicase RecQ
MVRFAGGESCLMEFISRALDDPHAAPCNQCSWCTRQALSRAVERNLLEEAEAFLKHRYFPILPRLRDVARVIADSGTVIPKELRFEDGLALSSYGDSGWGRLVKSGKWSEGRFSDDLVAGAEKAIREELFDPEPEWITFIPSLNHPKLVQSFAERLGDRLSLPVRAALVKLPGFPVQKQMQNSPFQARNARDSLRVEPTQILPARVLLVDDMVDSRWTFTIAAALLRAAGSGSVVPFALARMRGGDQ